MVTELTAGAAGGQASLQRVLFLMLMKFLVLGAILGVVYFYNKHLIVKVIGLMILQLIIQVYSITNNHLKN